MLQLTAQPTLIITGAYGSGKTECAMALALQFVQAEAVTLLDLDFVNPYFRAQDHRAALEQCGVQIIAPEERVAQIDAPAMPPATRQALLHPTGRTLVDLGGDPAGAVVIGQYALELEHYDLWAVVNFARPTTATVPQAAAMLHGIATATRLHLTGLISNTHFGAQTTVDDVCEGWTQAVALGELLRLPVVLACVPAWLETPLPAPVLPITPRLRRPWEG